MTAVADRELAREAWENVRTRNDAAAWAELHRLMVEDLTTYAYWRLLDWDAADDAVQDAFVKLFEKREQVTHDGTAWLYAAVKRNTASWVVNIRNNEARRRSVDFPEDDYDERTRLGGTTDQPVTLVEWRDPYVAMVEGEQHQDVEDALDEVEEAHKPNRQIIEAKYYENKTAEEIAPMVGKSPNNVKMAFQRARAYMAPRVEVHNDRRYDAEETLARWRAARMAEQQAREIDQALAEARDEREAAENGWITYYTFWRRVGEGNPPCRIMLPRGARKAPRSLKMARRYAHDYITRYPYEELLIASVNQGRGRHKGKWYRTAIERHSFHMTTVIYEPLSPFHPVSTPTLSRRRPRSISTII